MKVGLALCSFKGSDKLYLFQAPKLANIEVGDYVKVEDTKDTAVVEKWVEWIDTDEEDYDMILAAAGATVPLKKIISKLVTVSLKYEEE